jgi:catechol 2,3-dioxygenase-like lactoylglutathione lyase family enzyme
VIVQDRSVATVFLFTALLVCASACAPPDEGGVEESAATEGRPDVGALPVPAFHHIHINAVDPEDSLDWWKTVWPGGSITSVAGFPAFEGDGVYLLYTEVDTQAPGAFRRDLFRSEPQSAFWTTGPDTDGAALYERLTALDPDEQRFRFLPVYTGPDDTEGVPHSGLGPFGDRLLTVDEIEELQGVPTERGPNSQDFGYLVDPDGVLVEFNGNPETEENFYAHTHFWHEHPLCAVDWYVENLGLGRLGQAEREGPCEVELGPVSYPTFIPEGQLRQPIGVVQAANAVWAWYTRQCRVGRCGQVEDRPLVPSRGQVVDHVALAYSDLDVVLAHLASRGVPVVEGPYPFGAGRAVLIEDLDGLSLELIEQP